MHIPTVRSRLTAAALTGTVLSMATAAALLGTGTAAAQSAPSVVGMSERTAIEVLTADSIPHSIVNRSGSAGGDCTVTAQRDRGYRTVIEHEYNRSEGGFDRVERQVWRGVGLTVVCR
ncbi:hypothetical protein [Rhodococcus sp. CH91]|uniref:hypothetical protein n=1 Tax=Rhodococcus sp. CH91 TaxID=2910256 RepID=UPI001F4A4E48|nr:hypothetical protein [Rhodococcus sp. CH91]